LLTTLARIDLKEYQTLIIALLGKHDVNSQDGTSNLRFALYIHKAFCSSYGQIL
jgi:hypothetical protein